MEKHIIQDIALSISEKELLRTLRIEADPNDEDYQTVTGMLHAALDCARPKFVYGLAAVTEKGDDYVVIEGRRIISPLVRRNLDQTHRIIPYIATCGVEAEEWSRQYTDMLEHFWADEIKKMILGRCIAAMRQTVQKKYFTGTDISQMNPGSLPEWPISEQANLFALIGDVEKDIGVTLTDSFLMLPSKSVSGFFFSSATHYENCRLCPMPNCPNRRVPQEAAI